MHPRALRPSKHALTTLALALSSAGAFSQTTEPAAPAQEATTTLPGVRVVGAGERAGGPVTGYTARRSATATRTDTPLNEVPQSITVIGAEQVRDQNSLTLQEVLRYSPGVNSETYGLDNRGDYFAVRGSDGTTLLDGLRSPITGYWGSVRFEPFAFERIEVLRGPSSLLSGQTAPGGVINLVSKRPQFQPSREVQVQLGTDNHKLVAADLTGPWTDDGKLAYRLVALGRDSGSQVDHADQKRVLFAPSLTWKPVNGTVVTVYGEYQKDTSKNQNAFFPIQGTLTPAPNGPIPISTFISEPEWDTYGGPRKRFGWEVEQKLTNEWKLRHRLRHDDVRGHMVTAYAAWLDGFVSAGGTPDANPANNTYLNRVGYASDDHSRINNADLMLEGRLTFGDTSHTLLAGIDHVSHRMVHSDFSSFAMTPLDVYNPVYGTSPLPAFGPATVTESRVSNVGLLLQDQIKINTRWVIVAGLRHDKARNDAERDSANSKNLGVVYLANGGLSPYAGYSESFQPVAGQSFGGAAFKPSRGKQVEAGVKWMPADSRFNATAAVYTLKETNRLANDPVNVNYSIQVGEATVSGLELDVGARLPSWDLLANYSYTRARLTGEFDANPGVQLAGIRKHTASAWAVHRFVDVQGLRLGGGVRYIGSAADEAGNNGVPAVTLLDLLVGYETGPWSLTFNVNNLTDKRYIATSLSRGDSWFGTTRRGVLSASYRW